jgi:hypothetical protein
MESRSAFAVDNVEPGIYALKGIIRPSPWHDSSRIDEVLGRLWYEVVVPPFTRNEDLDIPIDLGTLAVLTDDLKPGDRAPDFDLPTFGPGRIRLADYRGKVLLVAFFRWGYWGYADSTSTAVQDLRGTYHRFGENPRYAQVSLVFSGNPIVDEKAIDEAQLPWPHGLVEGRSESKEATEYGMCMWNWPWRYILIGPQGQILAVDVSPARPCCRRLKRR